MNPFHHVVLPGLLIAFFFLKRRDSRIEKPKETDEKEGTQPKSIAPKGNTHKEKKTHKLVKQKAPKVGLRDRFHCRCLCLITSYLLWR